MLPVIIAVGAGVALITGWRAFDAKCKREYQERLEEEEKRRALWKEEERIKEEKERKWAYEAKSLTCRKCSALGRPISGSKNRYRCEACGNQFAGDRHDYY